LEGLGEEGKKTGINEQGDVKAGISYSRLKMPKMQRMHGLGENGGGGGGVVQTQREWVLVVVEVEIENTPAVQ